MDSWWSVTAGIFLWQQSKNPKTKFTKESEAKNSEQRPPTTQEQSKARRKWFKWPRGEEKKTRRGTSWIFQILFKSLIPAGSWKKNSKNKNKKKQPVPVGSSRGELSAALSFQLFRPPPFHGVASSHARSSHVSQEARFYLEHGAHGRSCEASRPTVQTSHLLIGLNLSARLSRRASSFSWTWVGCCWGRMVHREI